MKNKKEKKETDNSLERVNFFSDGIFAILITIMVLELKKPESPTFHALFRLWPTWISYAVSYLFIAIVWINHHYLMKNAKEASVRLMWANFAHLFAVSLIPFFTAWIAETELAAIPVTVYAFIFLIVNITYLFIVYETICDKHEVKIIRKGSPLLHVRSIATVMMFTISIPISFFSPLSGLTMIVCSLMLYVRPELPLKEGKIDKEINVDSEKEIKTN
ncbi:TMEM175 family protein [Pedobacter miscanthi]|uniref:DUF1211 domain-containing protein n=1 Tax=Pedobacter miscanthi TaxID=2259170 RepID=A0A366L1T1_9SPHI|nr:TMEM175 family protein [Pedobacter miscanthi]RBQ07861.1 DUF1211 domain-containing protein [Pedobacter miscanthi]